jgi:hypothetical protein
MALIPYQKKVIEISKSIQQDKFYLRLTSAEKVSFENDNSFSITPGPSFSCPGATDACDSCYACRNRHLFTNVMTSHLNNWVTMNKALEDKEVRNIVVSYLVSKITKKKIFRIHESGDFFSNKYIALWDNVVSQCPNTLFWCYTRSFMLNFKNILKNSNFKLFASVDQYNKKYGIQFAQKHNIPIGFGPINNKEDERSLTQGFQYYMCPLTEKKHDYSKNRCSNCGYCLQSKGNVGFKKH